MLEEGAKKYFFFFFLIYGLYPTPSLWPRKFKSPFNFLLPFSAVYNIPLNIKRLIYFALCESHLSYGNSFWSKAKQLIVNPLQILQKKIVRNLVAAKYNSHTEPIIKSLEILKSKLNCYTK